VRAAVAASARFELVSGEREAIRRREEVVDRREPERTPRRRLDGDQLHRRTRRSNTSLQTVRRIRGAAPAARVASSSVRCVPDRRHAVARSTRRRRAADPQFGPRWPSARSAGHPSNTRDGICDRQPAGSRAPNARRVARAAYTVEPSSNRGALILGDGAIDQLRTGHPRKPEDPCCSHSSDLVEPTRGPESVGIVARGNHRTPRRATVLSQSAFFEVFGGVIRSGARRG